MLFKCLLKSETDQNKCVYVSVHDLNAFFHASEDSQVVYSDNGEQSFAFKKDLEIDYIIENC
jgi:hypothetical protein